MSADAWTKCPKCGKEITEKLNALYGTVSMEEFDEQKKTLLGIRDEQTMRLDYEVYVEEGQMIVSAKAFCTVCEAAARLEEKVEIKEKTYD